MLPRCTYWLYFRRLVDRAGI